MRYKTYRHKYQRIKYMIDLALKCLIVGFLIGIWIAILTPVAEADFISPVASPVSLETSFKAGQETGEDKPLTPIEQDIKNVFGEYYNTAMLLLKGNGQPGACAENRQLDPNALNDNTVWGGKGKDWGIFQINDKWQGITHEGKAKQFLKDPAINIRIAWRLFEDSGYSFKLWTCGKVYGI